MAGLSWEVNGKSPVETTPEERNSESVSHLAAILFGVLRKLAYLLVPAGLRKLAYLCGGSVSSSGKWRKSQPFPFLSRVSPSGVKGSKGPGFGILVDSSSYSERPQETSREEAIGLGCALTLEYLAPLFFA